MKNLLKRLVLLLSFTLLANATTFGQEEDSQENSNIENIIITATKKESTIQDAPLAVTAFSEVTLAEKSINDALDIQFSVPNMLFSKSNFTGSNVSIRGIGNNAVAASADGGTGIHLNGAYIGRPRSLFEGEFYDVNRVEILRGPQGTLYGRNTTAGVINIVPNKPTNSETVEGSATLETTDYSGRKASFAVNLPFIKNFVSARMAGYRFQRDGIIFNEETENLIDDRDVVAYRSSVRIGDAPGGVFELILSRDVFEEKDSRLRSSKQICHKDTTAYPHNLGCLPGQSLYSNDAFGTPASYATLAGFLANVYPHAAAPDTSSDLFGKFLLPNGIDTNFNCEVYGDTCRYAGAGTLDKSLYNPLDDGNSDDLRTISETFDPYYETNADLKTANLNINFGNVMTLSYIASEQEDYYYTNADYNHISTDYKFDEAAAAAWNSQFGLTTGAFLFTNDPISTGHGQNVNNRDTLVAFDTSSTRGNSNSSEFRLTSNFGSGFNFMIGQFEYNSKSESNYEVHSNGLQFLSPGTPTLGYYNNHTQEYLLNSTATFGEVYFEGSRIRVTIGIRDTEESKSTLARQTLLNSATGQYLPGITGLGSLNTANILGGFGSNGNNAVPEYAFRSNSWSEPSTKFAIDFLGDNSLLYVAITSSYKSGGLNPESLSGAFESTFEPEVVNAIEIGNKWSYGRSKRNHFNWTFFNYDYEGLQTSKIIDRTSVNENIDATNMGLELEWKQYFTDNIRLDFTYSLLDTEITSANSTNTGDPANYYAYYNVLADGTTELKNNASVPHFINTKNGDTSIRLIQNPDYADYSFEQSDCGQAFDGGTLECTTLFVSAPHAVIEVGDGTDLNYVAAKSVYYDTTNNAYYVSSDNATSYDMQVSVEQLVSPEGTHAAYLPDRVQAPIGIAVDLSGNELPNAPKSSYNFSLNYTDEVQGNRVNVALEYYSQEDFYYRVYNTPSDLIQAWDVYNITASIRDKNDKWNMNFFIKNVTDDDFITGAYFTDASSGNFTNVFLLEPRTVGVNFTLKF